MIHTDPGWCYEHRRWFVACAALQHAFEADEQYAERRERETRPVHHCPSCTCVPSQSWAETLEQNGWTLS